MTTWIKTSDASRLLKAEIKKRCGVAAKNISVTKTIYGNILIDVSGCSGSITLQVKAIAEEWRSGRMGNFDNRENFTMYQLTSPFTGLPVVWNATHVELQLDNGHVLNEKLVIVQYDYINVQGVANW